MLISRGAIAVFFPRANVYMCNDVFVMYRKMWNFEVIIIIITTLVSHAAGNPQNDPEGRPL